MSDQPSSSGLRGKSPSIYLDYGSDAHECSDRGLEICDRGMHFSSRWQFSLGTQLAVAFSYQDTDGRTQRITTEAIIVDCQQIACKCYRTTLLFLEVPEPLRAVIRNSGIHLEADVADQRKIRVAREKASLN